MSAPIILLSGPAGSGKDTAASIIARTHNGVCVALADPMKRLAADVFGFSEEQLWGPSECRNAPDERYTKVEWWKVAQQLLDALGPQWLEGIGLSASHLGSLRRWFDQSLLEWHFHGIPPFDGSGNWWHQGRIDRVLTPRFVLQTLGTEWGRFISRDVWIDAAMRTATELLAGGTGYDRTKGLIEDRFHRAPDFVIFTDGRFRNEMVRVQMSGGTTIRIQPTLDEAAVVAAAGVAGHRSESELRTIPDHFFSYSIVNDKSLGLEVLQLHLWKAMQNLKARSTMHIYTSAVA